MSRQNMDGPPTTRGEWEEMNTSLRLTGISIHDTCNERQSFNSASKIEEAQYVLLRVIWKHLLPSHLKLSRYHLGDWKKEADRRLKSMEDWQSYCDSFSARHHKSKVLPGTFAMARKYQILCGLSDDNEFRSDFTPVAARLRSKTSLTQQFRQISLNESPSKVKEGSIPEWLQDDSDDLDDIPPTPSSEGPKEILNQMYPPSKDEEIVNFALIDFLNGLTVHFPDAKDWTPHRVSLKATFKDRSYEARTDGYLEDSFKSNKVRALVEVKPMQRNSKLLRIFLVSQDREEIYITFAEYSKEYVHFLNKKSPPGTEPPFLTMRSYGPWVTSTMRDMEKVGSILLAIALRAHSLQ
ncbi:uncharacterized protein N7459_005526 [Penicillium hispanicum]|uniref:uncharacterized protein n=1 Tax=Penicillium hispanicum TaxID=1080232 RepID=UPI00253F6B41|nr:uncharacterized protein N7459_005526 [Penicillium hispanicum]KAJ5579541.1 hypothetical protein N7459_005526 [Penicillium hispanicum]